MQYWEIIADKLSAAGWSVGYCSAVMPEGWRWIVDAHRGSLALFRYWQNKSGHWRTVVAILWLAYENTASSRYCDCQRTDFDALRPREQWQ